MEEQPYISDELAQKLFQPYQEKMRLQKYIEILEKEQKLKYLTCNQFCKAINDLIQGPQVNRFINQFKLQFLKSQKAPKKYNYHFPFINQEKEFTKHILHTFVIEYVHEQTAKSEKYDEKQLLEFNQANFEKNNWNLDEKDQMQQEQSNSVGRLVYFDILNQMPEAFIASSSQPMQNDQIPKLSNNQKGQEQVPLSHPQQNQVKDKIMNQLNQKETPKLNNNQKGQEKAPMPHPQQNQVKVQIMNQLSYKVEDFKFENNYIYKFDFTCQPEEITLYKSEKNVTPQKENQTDPQKILKMDIKSEVDNKFKNYIVPGYFKDKIKAVSTLLALNFTDYLKKELDQIKDLLKKHIGKLPFYYQYYRQYQYYRKIVEGTCESDLNQTTQSRKKYISQIETYYEIHNKRIKYLSSKRKSIFMQTWQFIFDQLKNQSQSYQSNQLEQIINRYLFQGIESIYLIFKVNDGKNNVYGFTKDMKISININYLPQNHSLQHYRKGVMKPYVAFTAYHELAHFLIRAFNKEANDNSGQSFRIGSKSLGQQILDIVLKVYKKLSPYLKLKMIKQRNQIGILQAAQKAYHFLKVQQKSVIQTYEKISQQFNSLLTKIKFLIGRIQSFPLINNDLIIHQNSWLSLGHYVFKLSKNQVEIVPENNEDSEFKYQIFFSYFLIQRIMKDVIQNFSNKKNNYEQLCNLIKNLKVKRYYIQNNQVIERFCSEMIRQREKTQHQKRNLSIEEQNTKIILQRTQFLQLIKINLNSGAYSPTIDQQINFLCEKFQKQALNSYFKEFNQFVENNDFQSIFKHFTPNKYSQLNEKNFLSDLIENRNSFKKLLNLYETYEMMMNLIKYSQILTVIYQVPSFFSHDDFDLQGSQRAGENERMLTSRHNLESGYQIQRRMFPYVIKSQTIYEKDYKLMQDIKNNESRLQIGKRPQNPQEQKKKIAMRTSNLLNSADQGFSLRLGSCGNYLIREAELKKEREMKDAKRLKLSLKKQ